jgi:teichuronic acid biosynthesis glycosyltransferase TuaC
MIAECVQPPRGECDAANSCPRILFVIPGPDTGSSMVFARRQAETLRAMGASVDVFYLKSRTSPRLLLREFLRFRRVLAETRPGIVHAHFGTMTAMFVAFSAGRIPVVVTYRGSDLNASSSTRGVRSFIGRVLSQLGALRASWIVCVSCQLRERLWWRRSLASVLPSGVDARTFHPMNRNAARRTLGWPIEERIVLFNAGHDPRNKRLDLARAAAVIAARMLGSIRLEVLDGSVDPARMPLLMNASDCLLVTSDSEGSPTMVQEALACNLPIVSVDAGDIRERLAGVAETRIAQRDPGELAEALCELVHAPVRSDGRKRVHEFCSQRIAEELLRIYTSVAPTSAKAY